MNMNQIKIELIRSAQEKLRNHEQMGSHSKLSILEVAQLRDIVAGNVELKNFTGSFFGLHSLN